MESIAVLTPAGNGTGPVVIEWKWSPRVILDSYGTPVRDILIMWKTSNRDHRPWTPEEDDAIRRLWPATSGATRDDIKDALLPGRNFSSIQTRTEHLKIGRGANRSDAWRTEWRLGDHTYGEKHPEILYMQVLGWARGAAALVRRISKDMREHNFGLEGDWRNAIFVGKVLRDDPVAWEYEPIAPDQYTDKDIHFRQYAESVDYRVVNKTAGGVSQLGHEYLPELLSEEDREMLARMGSLVRWEVEENCLAEWAVADEAKSHSDYSESQSTTNAGSPYDRSRDGLGSEAA